jgi:hypothetical protein
MNELEGKAQALGACTQGIADAPERLHCAWAALFHGFDKIEKLLLGLRSKGAAKVALGGEARLGPLR